MALHQRWAAAFLTSLNSSHPLVSKMRLLYEILKSMLQLWGAIASKKTAFRKKTTTKEQLW
ncbi:MAG: hypothetical protein ACKPEN_22280 [Planktothrix sp.]|uniref:hypothetical protein n=1 Tax=Planktothrix sp. TaxID=3088171 RepID=UPI0038D3EA9E